MKSTRSVAPILVLLLTSLGAGTTLAQDAVPPSLPTAPVEPNSPEDLAQQIEELRQELRRKEEQQRQNASRLTINGYVDIGFFAPLGNDGAGWVQDTGSNRQYPEYAHYGWTFLGDILATAVNTRGEPADLGNPPNLERHDSIDSNGAGGMLANELNLRVGYRLAERAIVRASVNFVPRSGRDFSLGDLSDVDLAEVEYHLTADGNTALFVGKTLPVFGIEYKDRKSHQRFGITPSPVHRYTAGPQLGIKLRSTLWNGKLILAAAASNNSSVTENFHFQSEIDRNWGKTLSGRAALSLPIGAVIGALDGDRLELGASGLWGPQDWATDVKGKTTFWGFDLQYLSADYALKAQVMKGSSPGRPEERVWLLDLDWSGYVEANWQALSFFGVMLRAGLRKAEVELNLPAMMDRAYVTRNMQFTGGMRFVFNEHAMLKLEYVHNREYGRMEQIDNDIATSSLVLHF